MQRRCHRNWPLIGAKSNISPFAPRNTCQTCNRACRICGNPVLLKRQTESGIFIRPVSWVIRLPYSVYSVLSGVKQLTYSTHHSYAPPPHGLVSCFHPERYDTNVCWEINRSFHPMFYYPRNLYKCLYFQFVI